jgi:hypothetical protein
MTSKLMPVFRNYPAEAQIIGRLLTGYGELEFEVAQCLAVVIGADSAFRAMFRLRSEKQRLDVADAIMRPRYRDLALEAEYADAYAAVDRCRQIRNQYAHCHWSGDFGRLQFTNLERVVEKKNNELMFGFTPVDFPLLQEQEAYFSYSLECLWFLYAEARLRAVPPEQRGPNPHPKPKRISPARLDSRPHPQEPQGQAWANGLPHQERRSTQR